MLQTPSTILVDLGKYINTSGERPMIIGTNLPVCTVAYRALSGSWGLDELAYEFCLEDVQLLAALLYYMQYRVEIDTQEEFDCEMDAMD